MTQTTFKQTIQQIGTSRYIRVPSDYLNHGYLEEGEQYEITMQKIEEEEDE